MPVIVVGGQARNIGKTSLITSLISRFSQFNWTAVKVTSHQHEARDCVQIRNGLGWSVWKQMPSSESSDTTRYLEAGSRTALLLQADDSGLSDATSFLNSELSKEKEYVVIESTRIAEYLQPECFVMLLNNASTGTKHLAPECLLRADAFICAKREMGAAPSFEFGAKPVFRSSAPGLVVEEFWDFISEKLRVRG
jgi:hypothetical protein